MQENPTLTKEHVDIANSIGDFIRYWGFKRIHGRIWAYVFLAPEPIDAGILIERLNVSKSLISMSLQDLKDFGVIEEAGKSDRGTIVYRSNDKILPIITRILGFREYSILQQIDESIQQAQKNQSALIADNKLKELSSITNYGKNYLKILLPLLKTILNFNNNY